jgi:hypothetical protein
VSIAHNQIKEDFKPINTSEKGILKKKCSECGGIKPITEFNLTITGKRHQDRCNDCEILSFKPKAIPKVVGQGKPLFSEGKAHQTSELQEEKPYKLNKGKCKTCNTQIDVKELYQGLCPDCKEKKLKMDLEERLNGILCQIETYMSNNEWEWFTAKDISDYTGKSFNSCYNNLKLMFKEFGMVDSVLVTIKQKRRYFRVV